MEPPLVYCWGFTKEELAQWPDTLRPVATGPGRRPPESPVVVHAGHSRSFLEHAGDNPLPDGRLVDAVLYLPQGMAVSVQEQSDFVATVREGEWDTLRRLVAHPQQFALAELADELPASFVRHLERPLAQADAGRLPLPEAARAHLSTCPTCWGAFSRALENRLWLRRQLLCPGTERLAAYVRGKADAQVEEHLRGCRACQAQVTVLRQVLTPAVVVQVAWTQALTDELAVAVRSAAAQLASATAPFRQAVDTLAVLLNGGFQLRVAGSERGWPRARGESVQSRAASEQAELFTAFLELVQQGTEITLVKEREAITLRWDGATRSLRVGSVCRDDRPVERFRIALRRGPEVLDTVDSQQGEAVLAMDRLQQALSGGADQFVVLAPG